jgi:hypothetical protein
MLVKLEFDQHKNLVFTRRERWIDQHDQTKGLIWSYKRIGAFIMWSMDTFVNKASNTIRLIATGHQKHMAGRLGKVLVTMYPLGRWCGFLNIHTEIYTSLWPILIEKGLYTYKYASSIVL